MCNELRFRLPLDRIVEEFSQLHLPVHWAGGAPNLEPRDSIWPTDPAAVLTGAGDGVELKQLRWGFARPKGGPLINFRSDDRRFPTGRCLVPVDGFYEYTGAKAAPKTQKKSKWLFTADNDEIGHELFCLAGLVRDERFTLLTTEPGPDIAPYHDRQIVILPRRDWAAWLAPMPDFPPLGPLPAGSLKVTQIR